MFAILFLLAWVLGAAITAKAAAMDDHTPTHLRDFCVSLVNWPIVAIGLLFTKHDCANPGHSPDYHY